MAKRIIVQIYEIQTPAEAQEMIEIGVDHIGSVVLSKDDWKIPTLRETFGVTAKTGAKSCLIPLFGEMETIFKTLDYYRPDIVHFCEDLAVGDGIFETCDRLAELQENVRRRFPEIKTMRSIPIPQSVKSDTDGFPSIPVARKFAPVTDFFLTDTLLSDVQPVDGYVGITGKTCDWDIAAELVETCGLPVILAGGIAPENTRDGILRVRPAGIDSCTGTNAADESGGTKRFKKDPEKVRQLVRAAREAETEY